MPLVFVNVQNLDLDHLMLHLVEKIDVEFLRSATRAEHVVSGLHAVVM